MPIEQHNVTERPAWNTGRLIGPKPPLKPRHNAPTSPSFFTPRATTCSAPSGNGL